MGPVQILVNKTMITSVSKDRVPYEEESNNGYVIGDKYIPEELLLEILGWVDYKSLLACQLVCKRWNILIQDYVWKRKAEIILKESLTAYGSTAPWTMYYYLCDGKFGRNLLKNHSGHKGLSREWIIVYNGGDGWKVECPPQGVPELPDDDRFKRDLYCFVTSYRKCWKYQVVDLTNEGVSEHFLDVFQPPIKVSEYYSCRWDCSAIYICTIELLTENDVVIDSKNFFKQIEGEEQNQWHKFEHRFLRYGKGLRKIRFSHGGNDKQFWAGHYGAKMGGACIQLELPVFNNRVDEDD